MTRLSLRWGCVAALVATLGVVVVSGPGLPAFGQEPSGLAAAAALEEVLVKAIAASEHSVVAIARVSRRDNDRLDTLIDPFNRVRPQQPPRPGDPDFIPNEYATGVVVDAAD